MTRLILAVILTSGVIFAATPQYHYLVTHVDQQRVAVACKGGDKKPSAKWLGNTVILACE